MSLESGLRVLFLWTLLCAALLKGGATAKTRVVSSGGIQMLLSSEYPNPISGLLDPKLEPHPGVSPGNSFWKSGGASSADGILAVTNGQKDSSHHWPSVWLQNAGVQSVSSSEHQEKTSHSLFPMMNAVKPGLELETRHQSANVLASSKRFKAGASQSPNIGGEKQSVWVKIKPLNVADERSSFLRGQEQRRYFSEYDKNAGLDVEYKVLGNQNQVVPRNKEETLLGHSNYKNNAYSVHKYHIWPAQKANEQISNAIFNSEREKAKMGKQRSLYWSRRQQSKPAKGEIYENFTNRLDELRKQSLESLSQNSKSPNADENHVQEMSLYERPGLELYHSSVQDKKQPWKPLQVAATMAQAENGRRLQSSVRNGQKEQGHEAKQSPRFITVPPLGKDYVVSGKQFFTNTVLQAQKMSPFQRSSKRVPQDASPSPSKRPQKTVALPNRQTDRQELTMQELPLKSTGLVDNSMDFLSHLQPSSSIQSPNNLRNDIYTSFGLPPNTNEELSQGSKNGHVRLRHSQAAISSLKLSEDSKSNVPNRHASRLQTAHFPHISRQPQSQENGQTENTKFSSLSGLLEESWRRNLNLPQLSHSFAQMSRLQAKEANSRINAGRVFPLSAMHQHQQSLSDLVPDDFQNGSSRRLKTAEVGQGNMKPSNQPVLYTSKKAQISNGFPGSSWLPNQFSLQRKLPDSDDLNEAFRKSELNTFGPSSEIQLKSPGLFLQQTFGYLPTSQTFGKVGANPNYSKRLKIQKPPFHLQSASTVTQQFKGFPQRSPKRKANTTYRDQFSHWIPNLPHSY